MKVVYNNIKFDSDLEVNYYKFLVEQQNLGNVICFKYHPSKIKIDSLGEYTPDFIVEFKDKILIIETKGYSQFSFMRDNMIHKWMTYHALDKEFLKKYVSYNSYEEHIFDLTKPIDYQKIKHTNQVKENGGFVDWSFKPRKAIDNARDKIKEQQELIKELESFKKDCITYFKYYKRAKLTEHQKEVIARFLTTIHKEIDK